MVFDREGLLPEVLLEVDNEKIENLKSFKFLGITIDSALNFQAHYNDLYNKLLKVMFIIRYLAKILPPICVHSLYFAYFHSHLTYGLPVWYLLLNAMSQNSIILLQKRITRSTCNANFREHCMPLFKKLGVLTLGDGLLVSYVKLLHRIESGVCPTPLKNLYVKSFPQHNTRGLTIAPVKHKND